MSPEGSQWDAGPQLLTLGHRLGLEGSWKLIDKFFGHVIEECLGLGSSWRFLFLIRFVGFVALRIARLVARNFSI